MKRKQGISLIVLIITIIIVIILATAVILSIANNNPIDNAKKARDTHNEATLKEAANLAYLDWYSENAKGGATETAETAEVYVKRVLGEQGFSSDEIAKVEVTGDGVTVRDITFAKKEELALGKEVTASNGEEFYIIGGDTVGTEISSSTQDIILLSKYCLKKENEEITLKQDASGDSNGCAFSSTNYWIYVEGISDLPDLNDEEKNPIGSGNTSIITTAKEYGASLGVTGRLMTSKEVSALEAINSNILYGKDTPNGCLLYWFGTAFNATNVFVVHGYYGSVISTPFTSTSGGVRPVITISKSLIK